MTQGGLEWVKVSTVTETRLLFEQAKAGWEYADSSSDEDESSVDDEGDVVTNPPHASASPSSSPSPSTDPIEILRLATDLQTASVATQIRYRHPSVRLVLPKIPTNPSPTTLAILTRLLATGASIQIGPSLSPFPPTASLPSPVSPLPPSQLSAVFPNLLPNPHIFLTPTLNIDCTILLALISDLSHSPQIPHSPSHHRAITRQIELEARDHLLPECLYPALEGRDLICTSEAATRMREIVAQIGTQSERARAELLFNSNATNEPHTIPSTLLARLAAHSEYPVPATLRLPILIHASPEPDLLHSLPPVARKVAAQLTAINRSVFLFGWARGLTTVSSNRAVAKLIESVVAGEHGDGDGGGSAGSGGGGHGVVGPEVWVCATARSLVGKERARRD